MLGLRLRELSRPSRRASRLYRCGACRAGPSPTRCIRSGSTGATPTPRSPGGPTTPGRRGRRLAVYVGLNIEHFAFGAGLGACIGPKSHEPDVLNYSWRDYGNRVGAWRCLELFGSSA